MVTLKYAYFDRLLHEELFVEEWDTENGLGREDGPSYIVRNSEGTVYFEQWHKEGKLHRIDGPAFTRYHRTGEVETEIWFVDGLEIEEW